MRSVLIVTSLAALALLSGCSRDDRQWMKVEERYTTEEFRRDYAECTKRGKLDDDCMRARGWVSVSASKDKSPTPEQVRGVPKGGRY